MPSVAWAPREAIDVKPSTHLLTHFISLGNSIVTNHHRIVGQFAASLGRDFDGDYLDEIGGPEPPELAKLVTPHLTSSCHALEGLGVNFEECCGFFCVDQRLDPWVTDCRDSCGWFLYEVHCVSPLVGGAIRSKSLTFSFFEG
jgi:hypothetical protein